VRSIAAWPKHLRSILPARSNASAQALIIDVRDPDEWDDGHVDGAVLIPLGELAERQREIPRDRDVIMMCQSGRRSAKAQRQLSDDFGLATTNLAGGIKAWREDGLPVA